MKKISNIKRNLKEGAKTVAFLAGCFVLGYGIGSIAGDIYEIRKGAK